MSLLITTECISCGACVPECPNEAIFESRSDAEAKGNHVGEGQGDYVITNDRCTECVGHFDEPQCSAVCPVDNCCISDPAYPEGQGLERRPKLTSVTIRRARRLGHGFVNHG